MNGALSDSPMGALDPKSMALMQMGLQMMGQGPSRMPVSFGQSLGQAGQQGLQAFQQAQQSQQKQQLFQMQMAEQQRAEEERKKRESAQAQLMQNPEYAKLAPFIQAGLPMTAALDRVMPKPTEKRPMVVGKSLVNPDTREVLYSEPEKAQGPMSDLGKLEADFKAGLVSQTDYQAKKTRLTTHAPAPSATVITKQEGEFGKAVGKEMGDMYSGLLRADMNAPATIGKYQRLQNMLGQVNTGKFTGTTVDIKAAAKGLGIDLNALGIQDNVAPAQAARALSNQLALELRSPAGGAGMPGAMSDQDREFLLQMVPSLETDPGAVGKMIEYRTKLAQREQQVARRAREYRKKNGKFDEGFFDELQEWSNANPMFKSDAPKPAKPAGQWSITPKAG